MLQLFSIWGCSSACFWIPFEIYRTVVGACGHVRPNRYHFSSLSQPYRQKNSLLFSSSTINTDKQRFALVSTDASLFKHRNPRSAGRIIIVELKNVHNGDDEYNMWTCGICACTNDINLITTGKKNFNNRREHGARRNRVKKMKKFSIPWDAFILSLCRACQSNLMIYAWRKQFALEGKKLDTFL